jgi:hypothetical protein
VIRPPDNADEILAYNGAAWDPEVRRGNKWTRPVSSEEIARARAGELPRAQV